MELKLKERRAVSEVVAWRCQRPGEKGKMLDEFVERDLRVHLSEEGGSVSSGDRAGAEAVRPAGAERDSEGWVHPGAQCSRRMHVVARDADAVNSQISCKRIVSSLTPSEHRRFLSSHA